MNMRLGEEFLQQPEPKKSTSKEREFVSRESAEFREFALRNDFKNMGFAESYAFALHANELKLASLQRGIDSFEEALSRDLDQTIREKIQSLFDAEYNKLFEAQTERSNMLFDAQMQLMTLLSDQHAEAELVARMEEIMASGSEEGKVLREKFATANEALDVGIFGGDMDDLVLFLNGEAKRFKEKREVAFEQFKEWVNEFFNRALDPECQKYLKRSSDEVYAILRKVNFAALDSLKKQTYLGHADGSHVALKLRQIDQDPEGAKHTVHHELAHHLSGLGMAVESVEVEGGDTPVKMVRRKKIGTSFNRSSGAMSDNHKNNWLNEALTELISSKISGVSFERVRPDGVTVRSGYGKYIDEVWEMVDAGITWDELYDAWAEDMLVEPENGTRIPKYDHLIRRIREVEGRGAMKRHVENIKNKGGGMRVNEETGERYRMNPKKLRLDQLP